MVMSLFRRAGLLLVKRVEGVFMTVMIKDLLSEDKLAIAVWDEIK